MKNFLKNNKFTIVAIAIFLVIVLLLVQVKNIFFPQRANALYGDRLKGIEEVKITEKDQEKIKSTLESDGGIKTATVRTSGKTLEVIITVNDDVSLGTAKPYVNKILEADSNIGIGICGTGVGMSIACNKIKGIIAGNCFSKDISKLLMEHNKCNVLCFGGRLKYNIDDVIFCINEFISSECKDERHIRRVNKINNKCGCY